MYCIVNIDVLKDLFVRPDLKSGFALGHHLEEFGDDLGITSTVDGREAETDSSEAPGIGCDDYFFGDGFGLLVRCCV